MSDRIGHTPGPWAVGKWKDGQEVYIDAPNGEPEFKTSRWEGLAVVFGSDDEDSEMAHRKCEANANLIAAAPGLLEALRSACDTIILLNGLREDWSSLRVQDYREAIAKAEGRS